MRDGIDEGGPPEIDHEMRMRMPSPRLILLSLLLAASNAPAAEPPPPSPSRFTPVISSIPVQEVGLPETIRTDGREFLVVPWRAEATFWVLDAETGERRKVNVATPGELSHVTVSCVERVDKERLVASASWVEEKVSRGGLLFMDNDGKVDRHVGYGFSVRSIVVGPTREWIVAAIQEPQDPTSEEINRATINGLAYFTIEGKLVGMQGGALANMMASFEESFRTHSLRRVFLLRGAVVLTYPFPRERGGAAIVWIDSGGYLATKSMRKRGFENDYAGNSLAPLHRPRLGEVHFRGAKPIGIVPVVSEGKSAFLTAWLTRGSGEPEDTHPTEPHRSHGRLLLALYDTEGKEARKVEEVEDGTRIGELTASPDGTAYAMTFRDISKEWSISRIDF